MAKLNWKTCAENIENVFNFMSFYNLILKSFDNKFI